MSEEGNAARLQTLTHADRQGLPMKYGHVSENHRRLIFESNLEACLGQDLIGDRFQLRMKGFRKPARQHKTLGCSRLP